MAHRHVKGVSPYHSRTRIHAVRTDKPGQAARGLPRRSSSVSFLSEADQSSIMRTPETLPGSAGAPDCIAEYPQSQRQLKFGPNATVCTRTRAPDGAFD